MQALDGDEGGGIVHSLRRAPNRGDAPATNLLLGAATMPAMPATRIPGVRLLHSPGPTHVPDAVVHAMSRQPTDLADPRLADLIAACESGMKELLGTSNAEVFFYAANGHGGWEAVIANLVAPGAPVLVPGTGHFSDSWAEQVAAFGGVALRTPYREGHPIDPAPSRRRCATTPSTASAPSSPSTPTPRAERRRTSQRSAVRSTRRAIPRSSSSTSSRRSPPRRSRWTRSAPTSRSARRRKG
jgi:hypothetical protein